MPPVVTEAPRQDARGRWCCNIVCEIERPAAPVNGTKVIGIDLSLRTW